MISGSLTALLTLAVHAGASGQQGTVTPEGFTWRESMPAGAWLRVHNWNGPIEIRESTSGTAEVRAELRPSNGGLPEVGFRVVRDGSDITICAMPAEGSTCTAEGIRSRNTSWRRGSVAFTVLLPRGVKVEVGSGSGSVTVHGAGADVVATSGSGSVRVQNAAGPVRGRTGSGTVEVTDAIGPVSAHTGSGAIRVSTSAGPVTAHTGSGNIDVSMRSLPTGSDLEFTTGSGGIRVRLPRDYQGEVDARTGSGRVQTDFPVTLRGDPEAGRLRGTIGGSAGGRLRMSSGSGALEIREIDR